jgi:beta-barrel assembly-enhancing protease
MRAGFSLLAFFALIGSVMPRDPSVLALQAQDMRVASIGYHLATANVVRCPKRQPHSGLILHSLGQYGRASRTVMQSQFGVSPFPTVQGVVPGSAAARASVYEGDVILAVNGTAMPHDLTNKPRFDVVDKASLALEMAFAKGSATLTLVRGVAVRLTPAPGCPSLFQVVPSSKLTATAAGRYVQLSSGIVDAARDEDELAFVIAHEMAHNILEHKARLDKQGRKAAAVLATEIEADEVGLQLMRGAGYDPHGAERFWAREGDRMDAGLFRDGTHLSPGKRTVMLQSIANRIAP